MLLGAVLLLATSCSKEIGVSKSPDFEVTTEATTYKVGEEITFSFSGTADYVTFYSGTLFNNYDFREGRIIDVKGKGALLSFNSSVQQGAQTNQLSILASTNFSGDYSDLSKVKAATWKDITSGFLLGTDATFRASTEQDISDVIEEGKPLYIAFKYVTRPQATNQLARNWFIQAFTINSKEKLGTTALRIVDQAYAAFTIVDENKVNAPARSLVTSTRISLLGNLYKQASDPVFDPNNPIYDPTNPIYDPKNPSYVPGTVMPIYVPFNPSSPYNDPLSEHWVISKAISVDKVELGIDKGVPIRNITNPILKIHKYTFTAPGEYTVTFVAANTTIDETKNVVKQIKLTIEP